MITQCVETRCEWHKMGPAADNRSSSEQTTDDAAGEAIGERHRLCRALGLGGRYTVRLPASRHRSASTARLPGRVRKRCTSRPIVLRVNTRLTCTSIPESGSQVLWTSVLHEDLARVSTARNTDKSPSGERGFENAANTPPSPHTYLATCAWRGFRWACKEVGAAAWHLAALLQRTDLKGDADLQRTDLEGVATSCVNSSLNYPILSYPTLPVEKNSTQLKLFCSLSLHSIYAMTV